MTTAHHRYESQSQRVQWPWLLVLVSLVAVVAYCLGSSRAPAPGVETSGGQPSTRGADSSGDMVQVPMARDAVPSPPSVGVVEAPPHQALERASEDALEQTRYFANLERENFEKELRSAEGEAGSSTIGYLRFLEAQLNWTMRRDAVASIDAGQCYMVPGGHSVMPDLFQGVPYLAYTTGPTRNGQSTKVAVPMIEAEAIKELQRTVRETRQVILERYVAEHNLKPEAERAHVHERFGSEIVGLPAFVADMVRYRLRWSEDGQHYLRIVP
jgi:hypothetical protein